MQSEFVAQVQDNKKVINELGAEIDEIENNIQSANKNSATRQTVSETILQHIEKTKNSIEGLEQESKEIEREVKDRETVLANLGSTLDEIQEKKNQTKSTNASKSSELEEEFKKY